MKKTYLEIQVPLGYNDLWLANLRDVCHEIPIKWQKGFYHITMAFIDETPEDLDLAPMLQRYLSKAPAPRLSFDKLDVFTTGAGVHIIYLTATNIPDSFLSLTESIREEMEMLGCKMYSSFRLHVTLGRISETVISLEKLEKLVALVPIPVCLLTLTDVDYRVFRGEILYRIKLKDKS